MYANFKVKTHQLACIGIITTLYFFLIPAVASAQVPGGSYLDSCRSIALDGHTLTAQCGSNNGHWVRTRLDHYRSCTGDIWNDDGNLGCDYGILPPQGSYQGSCSDYWLEGDTLSGACWTMAGNRVATTLNTISACIGDIANIEGQLRCSKGAWPPGGSYQDTCYAWREGNTLFGLCGDESGRYQASELPDVDQCIDDISNQNGILRCHKGALPPWGSYQLSCRDYWMQGDKLSAICWTMASSEVSTTLLSVSACVGDVTNVDGQLRCSRGAWPPEGSYQDTCYAWRENNTLLGYCSDELGRFQNSELIDIQKCVGDIANFDGTLRCNQGVSPRPGSYQSLCKYWWPTGNRLHAQCGRWRPLRDASLEDQTKCIGDIWWEGSQVLDCSTSSIPEGSYRETCRKIKVTDNILRATCRDESGGELTSSMQDFSNCTAGITNINGRLQCGGPPPPRIVVVPELLKHPLKEARQALSAVDLKEGQVFCNGNASLAIVVYQSPDPGTGVPIGSSVDISCNWLTGSEPVCGTGELEWVTFCAACPWPISGGASHTEIAGSTCDAAAAEKDVQRLYGGCTVTRGECP